MQAIDAIQSGMSIDETLRRIAELAPDAVYSLIGAVSADEDREFLRAIRHKLPTATLIGCGDILLEKGDKWIEQGLLDIAVLDFTSNAVVRHTEGDQTATEGLVVKSDDGIQTGATFKAKIASVGLPPHHLFSHNDYRFPFAQKTPFASVLVDYGCPFNCSFCVMSGLSYHRRPMEEVVREIELLQKLGIKEFILWDQTFAAKRSWAEDFLAILPSGNDGFGWTCYTRPDKIDRDLAMEMSRKGCHTAIMGIETANDETLKALRKGFTTEDTRRAFSVCREAGITTVGTAIVGLPGETEEDIRNSIDFVCEIDPDYLSLHTAIPRSGTELRKSMIEQGLVAESLETMDQSGDVASVLSDSLSAEQIKALHRTFTLRFYLRPKFLLRTAIRLLKKPDQLMENIRQGLNLIFRNRKPR